MRSCRHTALSRGRGTGLSFTDLNAALRRRRCSRWCRRTEYSRRSCCCKSTVRRPGNRKSLPHGGQRVHVQREKPKVQVHMRYVHVFWMQTTVCGLGSLTPARGRGGAQRRSRSTQAVFDCFCILFLFSVEPGPDPFRGGGRAPTDPEITISQPRVAGSGVVAANLGSR